MSDAERNSIAPDAGGVGDRLRAGREAQGLSIAQVAERTRIPTRHLATIESGGREGLPAATYSAGFVKTYARLLGLDGAALSRQFRDEMATDDPAPPRHEPYEPADPARTPSRLLAWSMLGLAILLGLGYLYWRGMAAGGDPVALAARSGDRPAPAGAPPATATPADGTAPAPQPSAGGPALLTADQQVWIKVYEMGGATLFMGLLKPGDHYAVPAGASDPRLLTSRPNALRVTVGGAVVPPLGPPEKRIKDVSLRPAALLARQMAGSAPGSMAGSPAPPMAAAARPVPLPPGAATPVENSAAPQ